MAEKKRLTAEQIDKQVKAIEKISKLTEDIKNLLPEFEGKAVRGAYENSVKNLETKNEKYSKVSFPISDEEKELIRKIRAGEIKTISTSPAEESEDEVSSSSGWTEHKKISKKDRK